MLRAIQASLHIACKSRYDARAVAIGDGTEMGGPKSLPLESREDWFYANPQDSLR